MNLKAILAFCVGFCAGQAVQAQFSYFTSGGTVAITGYNGPPTNSLTIPSSINGLPVTSIFDDAFVEYNGLVSVTIPGSVTSIDLDAFDGCGDLTNVVLGYGLTSIGDGAFAYCSSLRSLIIPGSVTSIGQDVFVQCPALAGVYFQGNAPSAWPGEFSFSDYLNTTVYYLPGTSGWGATFGGNSTAFWFLPYPLILNSGPDFGLQRSFGIQSNGFGFTISWATNASVVVQACSNLACPVWTSLQTNALTNGSFYFSEPLQTNSLGRFYRISSP